MNAKVCTCSDGVGVSEDEQAEVVQLSLAGNPVLAHLARRAGLTDIEATRFMYQIAYAPPEEGDLLIAWLRREQLSAMRRAKRRSDARAAAIARARAER